LLDLDCLQCKMTFDWTPARSGRTPQRLPRDRRRTLGDTGMGRVQLGHSPIQTWRYPHLEWSDVPREAVAILNQQYLERSRSKLKIGGGKK